jgi:acyl-CoA thioesterase-1
MAATCALCAAPPPLASGNPPKGRIIVLGDSITAGYGLDRTEAYPALLQKKIDAAQWPFEVVNAGVSGDTTAGGLRRIQWTLRTGAEVLIVALGGNDGLRGVPPGQTEENLRKIIEQARTQSPGLAILIAGMQMPANMGTDFTAQFASVFPRVARETRSTLIPFLLEGVGAVTQMNQNDLIHPNPEGQKRVAENVWRFLEPALKAKLSPP